VKIIMPAVMSADGRITKGDIGQAHHWSSKEDFAFFSELVTQHDALIMGRKTYEVVRPKPSPDKLRLVLTTHPECFGEHVIPGSLEFVKATPKEVVQELEKRGYTQALLVGGAPVHADFLREGLVDELCLTIEPLLFGNGLPLIEGALDIAMNLLEVQHLNKQGTLLLRYAINR
jgi:dihydrofolate reductase